MSHLYSDRHSHSSRMPYQRPMPQFDFNSRVKLPPIIKNELLTQHDRKASLKTATCSTSTVSVRNVCLPQIIENQPPRSSNQNGTSQPMTTVNRRVPAKKVTINHVEKSPIHFPNSYTVLPPIGQSRSWPLSGFSSTVQTSPRNSEQVPKIVPNQAASRRKCSEKTPPRIRPSVERRSERIKSLPNIPTNSIAIVHGYQKVSVSSDTSSQPKKLHKQNTTSSETLPCLSYEAIEMSECDPINMLEKLALSKEVEAFLVSKSSQRRGAKCTEIDPSLKTAADIIRDNLLRQTMEELCMMW